MIISRYLRQIGYVPRGIVHVGAHLAEEMVDYCDLGVNRLIWIEADPRQAERLRGLVAKDSKAGIQSVIEALITDQDGVSRAFYRFSNDGESSSVFRATQVLKQHWPNVHETGEVVRLETSRLDTALLRAGVSPEEIDVLVLDIQGAEVMALEGAGQFLAAASFVEAEVSCESIYAGGPLVSEVTARLAQAGFEPVTEIPWHGDVVFARSVR